MPHNAVWCPGLRPPALEALMLKADYGDGPQAPAQEASFCVSSHHLQWLLFFFQESHTVVPTGDRHRDLSRSQRYPPPDAHVPVWSAPLGCGRDLSLAFSQQMNLQIYNNNIDKHMHVRKQTTNQHYVCTCISNKHQSQQLYASCTRTWTTANIQILMYIKEQHSQNRHTDTCIHLCIYNRPQQTYTCRVHR